MLKRHAIQNQIKTLVVNNEVVKEQTEINKTHIIFINLLNVNPEKWSNTLKQIVGNLSTICLSVFDHFINLALKGLKAVTKILQYLQDKNLPKLNDDQCALCEKDITEDLSRQKVLQYLQDKNLLKLNDDQCPLFEKDNRRESKA